MIETSLIELYFSASTREERVGRLAKELDQVAQKMLCALRHFIEQPQETVSFECDFIPLEVSAGEFHRVKEFICFLQRSNIDGDVSSLRYQTIELGRKIDALRITKRYLANILELYARQGLLHKTGETKLGEEGSMLLQHYYHVAQTTVCPIIEYPDEVQALLNEMEKTSVRIRYGEIDTDSEKKELFCHLVGLRSRYAKLIGFSNFATYKLNNRHAITTNVAVEKVLAQARSLLKDQTFPYHIKVVDWLSYPELIESIASFLKEKLQIEISPLSVANLPTNCLCYRYHYDGTIGTMTICWSSDSEQVSANHPVSSKYFPEVAIFLKNRLKEKTVLQTLFHELGHAISALQRRNCYASLNKNTTEDLQEFPSRMFEFMVPEFVDFYNARDTRKLEVIPGKMYFENTIQLAEKAIKIHTTDDVREITDIVDTLSLKNIKKLANSNYAVDYYNYVLGRMVAYRCFVRHCEEWKVEDSFWLKFMELQSKGCCYTASVRNLLEEYLEIDIFEGIELS